MDSYDYAHALDEILPSVAKKKNDRGENGYMVLRPDSGDPIEAVLMALAAAEKVFGSTVNSKGFKVIKGCGGKSSLSDLPPLGFPARVPCEGFRNLDTDIFTFIRLFQ